ncbi:hypothetical protein D6850_04600 [Roseovarius spongiae]|uniref:Tat pathway signal sequence domain protein n=1 Tax=Roseovarius spongiae TaxID=2320272 RepID=A0A3A8AWR8_9RHOB|nr:hypothetical protein [Roseovarius spongiae]RKF16823.1 hypothetical protein D6850_04600 [Roseovarius spongiae]
MPQPRTALCRMRAALLPLIIALAAPAAAQEQEIGKAVSLELNTTQMTDAGCTLTFLVINGHSAPIDSLVYETVLFDRNGQVDRLTLFDFGALPPARPRVRQFSVPGVTCEGLGRILINGASTCESADLAPDACEAGLTLSSRTGIEVQG